LGERSNAGEAEDVSATAAPQQASAQEADLDVVIVGAGFGGIAAAIELRRHGITHVKILERAPHLGGTWFYNSYPGAACDVPSHLYSFSYAQRRDWPQLCPTREEIYRYVHEVARVHGVEQLVRANSTVTRCAWDADSCRWTLTTAEGASHSARALILATGQLHQPAYPRIEGLGEFTGHSFHSARWDHAYPLAGKRVAVVGTGASAVQFVPEIAQEAGLLTVFQRTGNWFMPRKNLPYPALFRAAVRHVPGLQAYRRKFLFQYLEAVTLGIRHPRTFGRLLRARSTAFMRMQLRDPAVRSKAWPDYTFGCKRVLFSSEFLPALQRPNVELVTDALTRVEPGGIRTADGRLHEVECIIWATGFRTSEFMFPMQITGAGGRDLREQWADGAHAHLGMTIPGFPNMFVMYGPNTNTSGGSIIFYLERQASYIRQALQAVRARGVGAIEVRPEVEAASDRAVQARFAGTAWTECDSWYRDEAGRIVANWPGYMREYRARTERLDVGEYRFAPLPDRAALAAAPGS
jgi:cation diffusion facilitator CzcD-associated flavoprotein CzcO